jgi:hypothetical protein
VKVDPEILADIRHRWRITDLDWPFLIKPCRIRILFYADFQGAYDNGPFDGLKQVIATLHADPYFWVRFDISLANRFGDPSADDDKQSKRLDELDLQNKYDEVWFFGFSGLPSGLSAGEISAIEAFMNNGGGVLVTGDHDSLGARIASAVPRAGKIRKWSPAPSQSGPDRHSTLREGPTAGYQFVDQSDDVPQTIRVREYPLSSFPYWLRRSRPHPVLCGPAGVITVLPDHMHEGEVVVPSSLPASEWPSAGGVQQKPEVIAWATVVQPGLDKTGEEFGVVGAYDGHLVNVGRVGADATWHHWFDINLIGENGVVGGSTGFNTPGGPGPAALKQIEAYFLNWAIWLAPPGNHRCMRNRLIWGGVWRDPLFMISPTIPTIILGGQALDALGKYASRCTILSWIEVELPVKFRLKLKELYDTKPGPVPPLLEEAVLGAALQPVLDEVRRAERYPERVDEDEVDKLIDQAFATAVPRGLEASLGLLDDSRRSVQTLTRLLQ